MLIAPALPQIAIQPSECNSIAIKKQSLVVKTPPIFDPGYPLYLITCVIFPAYTERSRIALNRHQEVEDGL